MKFRKRYPTAALLLFCYGLWLAGLVVWHLFGFVQNRVLYATGALAPATLAVADFDLDQMELRADGALVTTGADPKMTLKDTARRVENLTIQFGYSQPPRVVTAFWAAPGQGYSVRRVAYATAYGRKDMFMLPPGGGQALRLDPGILAGNEITVHSIQINQPRPVGAFFRFSAAEWTAFAIAPGLAACAISLVLEGRRAWPGRLRKPT